MKNKRLNWSKEGVWEETGEVIAEYMRNNSIPLHSVIACEVKLPNRRLGEAVAKNLYARTGNVRYLSKGNTIAGTIAYLGDEKMRDFVSTNSP